MEPSPSSATYQRKLGNVIYLSCLSFLIFKMHLLHKVVMLMYMKFFEECLAYSNYYTRIYSDFQL